MEGPQLVPEPVLQAWHPASPPERLSDEHLRARLKRLVGDERGLLAALIAHLAEFDRRGLHICEGYPSLFAYCTRELGYSEDAAFKRIAAARASRRFPDIVPLVGSGRIHLTAVVRLAPHLTEANHRDLLAQAQGKSKREIEFMVAGMVPKPEAADWVRRLPAPGQCDINTTKNVASTDAARQEAQTLPEASRIDSRPANPTIAPSPPPRIVPTAPQRVRFAFTGSEALLRLVDRAREILRHQFPAGCLEDIFTTALEALLEKRDPDRKRRAAARRASSRRRRKVPQWVRDEVWRRDGGRCAFLGPGGKRCSERGGLEFDHVIPWALGGVSDDPGNIRLLCRAHNQWRAKAVFGEATIRRMRRRG